MSSDTRIQHISDTALWVATYRAQESERQDALFQDPLAERLAGERGRQIAARMPYPRIMNWVLAIRTVAIDRLVLKAIGLGVDTVINLGAGLDTRPYRMSLPTSLRWIEVDFPHMIEFKSEKLAAEKPICHLEREAVDLSDIDQRRKLFARIGSEAKKALVITEGVVIYLSSEDAAALSRDLYSVPSFQFWIQDYRQGGLRQWGAKRIKNALKEAPFRFEAADWLNFFTAHGWKIAENILTWEESQRVHRPFPYGFRWRVLTMVVPRKVKQKWRGASGYVLYAK